MRKRIILLLDGTWNDADFGLRDTNIVRLREIISSSLIQSNPSPLRKSPQLRPGQRIASGRTSDDALENIVMYERGVGTDAGELFAGGSFGEGLDRNVRRAYRFLSFHYQSGDEIYVFGFSRGAYTARSLVGFIASAGLLRQQWCTNEIEDIAWRFYRTRPSDRLPGTWAYLSPYVHDRTSFNVNCLGLFDTVGALGVPLNLYRRINRQRYEFHSVDLSSITKVNLHALAVDEHRLPFQASVWRRPKFKQLSSFTEQVWFSGAHADVGGGYFQEDQRAQRKATLDDISLDWMLKRLLWYFPKFPIHLGRAWKTVDEDGVAAEQHNSRRHFYRLYPIALRVIGNYPMGLRTRIFERDVGRNRHAEAIGESVHVSVLQRMGHTVPQDNRSIVYRPKNVCAILSELEASYRRVNVGDMKHRVLLTGWHGHPLDPVCDRDAALDIISSTRKRLENG